MNAWISRIIINLIGLSVSGMTIFVIFNMLGMGDVIYYLIGLYLFGIIMGYAITVTTSSLGFIFCWFAVNMSTVLWFINENHKVMYMSWNEHLIILASFILGSAASFLMGAFIVKSEKKRFAHKPMKIQNLSKKKEKL